MNFIQKLKRFFRRISIPGLMTYVVVTMAVILIGDLVSGYAISSMLSFSRKAVFSGQVWRIITFLGLPLNYSPVWAVFSLMFYYSIGRDMESAWGSANVTAYLLTGALLTIIGGFLGGYAYNHYLYLSLFLAYAMLMPDNIFMMFFILPVKAKWLAIADAVYMGWTLIFGQASSRLSAAAAFAAFLIFFGQDLLRPVINKVKHKDFFHDMRRNNIRVRKGRR